MARRDVPKLFKEAQLNNLPLERRQEIARMGADATNKIKREKKEARKQRKAIVETLKDVLYSDVTNETLLQMLEANGIEGEKNYLLAMITSAILKAVKRGSLVDVLKLIEVVEGTATEKVEITNMDKTVKDLEEYLTLRKSKEKNK